MQIEYLFWSKTKVDILKYLIFKDEWLSARELETKLKQSFPAIKKQLDNLELAWVILKNKQWNKWNVSISKPIKPLIFKIFIFDIVNFLKELLEKYYFLERFLLWDFFFFNVEDYQKIWVDLVFIYNDVDDVFLTEVKKEISEFFDKYFVDIKVVFMRKQDYEKRLKYADKFVLRITKSQKNLNI